MTIICNALITDEDSASNRSLLHISLDNSQLSARVSDYEKHLELESHNIGSALESGVA